MTRYLHTMYRITDPQQSRAFYEALGLEFRRDFDIVRDGEKEATNWLAAQGIDPERRRTRSERAGPGSASSATLKDFDEPMTLFQVGQVASPR